MHPDTLSLNSLLGALRAAAEPTRLRLLAILSRNELTVSELTRILGQSQPRISRHLKLLCEAHLLDRAQEGSWVFYRMADRGPAAHIAGQLIKLLPNEDPEMERDQRRLRSIRNEHIRKASNYFESVAQAWDDMRKLYVAEEKVEQAMLRAVDGIEIDFLLDLGTGTGRILEIFSHILKKGLGIDLSREMLTVARANLEYADIAHCQVRHGDIHQLTVEDHSVDVVTIHHVLHFLDEPAVVVREAVRTLRHGGRILIVDFAPHQLEALRENHAHRRLGFSDDEVNSWLNKAGAETLAVHHLKSSDNQSGELLTVTLWVGEANSPGTGRPI